MVAMRMRWAGIAVLGVLTGCGRVAASTVLASSSLAAMVEAERACCATVKDEAEMVPSGKDGGGTVQAECLQHGCGARGSDAPVEVGVGSPINAAAINQQVGLRAKPTCDASEWHDRCPPGSAMILAHRRGGCAAAGCVDLEEEGLAALQGAKDDEDALLRAVVAQEAHRLREAGVARTFHTHSSRLRKDFEKSQKKLLGELKKTMATSPPSRDAEHVRALVEEAVANGFSNALIDDAKNAVLQYDGEQRAWSLLRSLPEAVVSKMVEHQTAERKEIDAKNDLIASLQDQVYDLVTTVDKAGEAAIFQEQRLTEARRMHQAHLDAGAAREAELEEKVLDLESHLRRTTELWGVKVVELERKLEVANAAYEDARPEVAELTSKVNKLEEGAVAERERHDAADFALREELAHVQRTADAAAKRCLEEQEGLHAERAVAVSDRDGARVSLGSCAVHIEEFHSRSVDLLIAVSEAACVGHDPVPYTGEEEAPSAVRGKDEYALDEVSERTRARLDDVETVVAGISAWRGEALDACRASLDALREDFVVVEKLLVLQEENTARAEEYGLDLAEELAFCEETDAETQIELDGCYADLVEMDSASADLAFFVFKKAFVAGSTIYHSGDARLETALDWGLPREDVTATFQKLRPRFEDIEHMVDSLVAKSATTLGTCVQDLQEARMREEVLASSREVSSGCLVAHAIGDDVGDDQGAIADGAIPPKPDHVAPQGRDIPPAG